MKLKWWCFHLGLLKDVYMYFHTMDTGVCLQMDEGGGGGGGERERKEEKE